MRKHVVDFYEFIRFLVVRFFEDRGTQNAGSLTYTTLFAVVPIMTVVFVMISGIPAFQGIEIKIQEYIVNNFLPSAGDKIFEYINGFISQARNLTWIGIIFLIVTTFMMLVTIESAFNTIWRVQKARHGLARFLLYWALLSLGPLLIGASFAASTYIMSLSFFSNTDANPWIADILRFAPFIATTGGFTLFYAAIPNTRVPIRHALISAVVAATLFEAARGLFGLYVKTFPSYQLIYGAFAAFPLFLLWIYVSWIIVLIGCELCCCLGLRHYMRQRDVPELVVALVVLKVLYDGQLKGRAINHRDVQAAGWSLPEDEWAKLLAFFKKEKLVYEVNNGAAWVLSRDINQYPIQRLIIHSPWPLPRVDQLPESLDKCWFERIRAALVAIEQAEASILEGSLASWLTPCEVESSASDDLIVEDKIIEEENVTDQQATP
ncbi:YihY family inner membrane protein [Entomomonas sp. E2T0]|uniref:YihY family inner membrane protein n=1 Tax=Entomomonas sp. E2T0 TaxID=2930213 RepID=UPI0022283404|nr:YihY family inner membrane protein [Entomomonas sp. E2T0]UYZ85005.1 YihY family inner membrane protein [Entomomonas sp. E2T0]